MCSFALSSNCFSNIASPMDLLFGRKIMSVLLNSKIKTVFRKMAACASSACWLPAGENMPPAVNWRAI